MAFAARSSIPAAEENVQAVAVKDAKVAAGKMSLLAQGSKRRAPLGDIGNLVVNRNGKDGKDVAGKPPVRAVPTATHAAAPLSSASLRASSAPALPGRVSTRSQTQAARQQPSVGLSMTSLLQSRSEAAVTGKKAAPVLQPCSPMPDIDSQDLANPLAAAEYVNDVFNYFRRAEPRYRVAPDYMTSQTDVNEKMRAILVDWLVEVHLKFKLMPESLFLTINLIDRFLAKRPVTRKNLQLVGVAGMLIASKYEEIWAPEVRDFVYIADKAYTREQILGMEKLMCNELGFHFTVPTPFNFLSRFLKAAGAAGDKAVCFTANYLVELSLPDYGMLKSTYSVQAAAAVHVALRAHNWTDTYPRALRRHSGYTLDVLLPCVAALAKLVEGAASNTLTAVHKKYSNPKFGEAAKMVWTPELMAQLQGLPTPL